MVHQLNPLLPSWSKVEVSYKPLPCLVREDGEQHGSTIKSSLAFRGKKQGQQAVLSLVLQGKVEEQQVRVYLIFK